ncbi:uncharacterized protein HRG_07576 [Hirsutella rhossiliensis]|uniref:Uncharacterized protein n=1 Tax=Hirsutella rhossiliensis TaxID=111463 RepID=A0A9P8MSS0_9HYPO|nr:uncharacterized protein HRG_07576 [Hirsutella rhossiliensis]KAH0961498.1 hypothetical protein HRG_07576 [Hirsutella rhossiliensis]
MDESAPKRRRVSSGIAAARTSGQGATPEASGSRRARPSFASPTKASLSRHNPEILEKRRSASPAKPPARRASDAGSDQSLSDILTARPDTTADNVAVSEPDRSYNEMRQGEAGPSSGRSVRTVRGGLAAAPRRSPAKPQPRPLPPPAAEGEDELNPFIGHTLRRSPNTGVSIPPPPEPELPPAVPDALSSTPPRGIHSSPSRPPPEPSKKPGAVARDRHRTTARSQKPPRDLALDPTTNHARQVPAFNPLAARLKERDGLREEIARLRSDLKTASEENERLRLMQTSGRIVAPTNEEGVVDLLHRCLVSQQEAPRSALSHQLMQAVLNPMGLLPFGRLSLAAAPPAAADQEDLESIKSHHPVSMTADKELPYLELFSQFSVMSSIAVLAPKPNQPLRQRRLVTLRSRDVPGLFTAKLEIVVNAMNLSIVELAVTALEPSAKYELEPFADKVCSGSCNRTMQRNVGILSWAMGEWYRVATLRAQFWSRLDRSLGSRKRLLESVAEAWEARRQRQREGSAEFDDDAKKQRACNRADLIRFLGQRSFEIEVPAGAGLDDTSSLRLEWKIDFDWTGEAQSKVAVLVGLPGKWREADGRGVFGRLPTLFDDLVRGGQEPEEAVRTVAALLAGVQVP